ncbi:heavy metal translocating P-type ATPase metal-binding domain-containing protein [Undibacterium danionis]|uniref:Heavy metal translocating P-type ATPase metal-binding domain-containing protein n=1 Tax=Undibacterium danionis TaxID=1812100 RepID=A0ABV6IGB9_9BURK
MHLALSQFCDVQFSRFSRFLKREKCLCFHCGESMRKDRALMATFQQQQHPVCCHGCLAVLHAIEKNHLVQDYLRSKVDSQQGKDGA